MTAIVGLVHQGNVYLAGDSRRVDRGYHVVPSNRPKVWRTGEAVIGSAGSQLVQQTVQALLTIPDLEGDDPYARIVTCTIPDLRTLLREAGALGKEDDGCATMDASLLIGLGGRLFEIQGQFGCVEATDGYGAIGSGATYALGALLTMAFDTAEGELEPYALRQALRVASHFNSSVSMPFHIVSTGEKQGWG